MDREKAIDEAKFSSGELREALVERHSEETQQKLEQGRVASQVLEVLDQM